jgi:hypothetical protein
MRIAAVLLALGCTSPAPPCKAALAHAKLNLDAAVRVCEANHWSAGVRRCLATAPDPRAVKTCLEPVELDLAAIYREQSDELRHAVDQERAHIHDLETALGSANARVAELVGQDHDLTAQIDRAVEQLASATSDAELAKHKATLETWQHERADLAAKLATAKQASEAAQSALVQAFAAGSASP